MNSGAPIPTPLFGSGDRLLSRTVPRVCIRLVARFWGPVEGLCRANIKTVLFATP